MSTTNFGNQILTWDYKSAGKSELFNVVNYKLLEKGIYEGGDLSFNDATHINVAPFVCYITDTATGVGVRVETTTSVILEVSSGSPFIVARMAWSNVENNYMDLLAVGFGSILTDDLILGRCLFPSGSLSATFDYARKSTVYNIEKRNSKTDLTVIPTEPFSDKVHVYGGTFFNSEKQVTVTGSDSASFSGVSPNTITNARIDLVYIDDAGAIQIEQGVDEASPTAPKYNSRKVLAEVYLDNTDDYIDGTSITLVDSSDSGQTADDIYIGTSITNTPTGGTSTSLSITDKIRNSVQEVFDRLKDLSGVSDDSVKSRHIDYGTSAGQVNIESIVDPISGIKQFPVYKDRTANGLIPFAFGNAISKTTYDLLYAEIGDIFEDQHVQAGDPASGVDNFYPTPIPGQYTRGGTEDSANIDLNTTIEATNNTITLSEADYNALHQTRGVLGTGADGVPIRLKVVSGTLSPELAIGTTYFIEFFDNANFHIKLHTTEASAIAKTREIDLLSNTSVISLTQEGVYFGDAMQQITGVLTSKYTIRSGGSPSGTGAFSDNGGSGTSIAPAGGTNDGAKIGFDSADSPDARTSNESRPKSFISFGYIKSNYVLL